MSGYRNIKIFYKRIILIQNIEKGRRFLSPTLSAPHYFILRQPHKTLKIFIEPINFIYYFFLSLAIVSFKEANKPVTLAMSVGTTILVD